MDDKLISEMVLSNISSASQINVVMSNLLNERQMQILSAYEQTYNYQPYLSFFLALGAMSHFSQNSYYTHFASPDRRPVQLYLGLLGSSGMSTFHSVKNLDEYYNLFSKPPSESIRQCSVIYLAQGVRDKDEVNRVRREWNL